MPRFDAVLFDFDGVLLDSEPMHWACWAQVLAPLGVTLDWDYYREHYLGVADREMIPRIAAQSDPPKDWTALWTQYPNKRECLRKRLEHPPFLPELAGLLLELRREYKLAVVSTSARAEVEPALEAGGIRPLFDVVITGENTERHKPAPDPYLLAARLVASSNPLVVEDSEPGIAAGRAAGFEVLEVLNAAEMPRSLQQRLGKVA
ncbi:MAG: HAD family phosphatase [Acidobacteriia bacterium]|nr:HAD family phosphatase [Terriglobia bacterium]